MNENREHLRPAEQFAPASRSAICDRQLIFLKSKLETRTCEEVISVHVTTVPFRLASSALNTIRSLLPKDGGVDLQHLRRFAKCQDVPDHVRSRYLAVAARSEIPKGFLIVAPTDVVTQQFLSEALCPILGTLSFFSIEVPLLAPTSQDQASLWTSRYWPTVYKKSNPFGPHPSIIAKAEEEIRDDVQKWMGLATEVAMQSKATGLGEAVGVVIVERLGGIARSVALAGDARWADWSKRGPGNVAAHAALRAIDMVAQQVQQGYQGGGMLSEEVGRNMGIFQGRPNLSIERENHRMSTGKEGYLCHELELYCTHEPCVMCAMAIVHSRFGKVVFKHRMPRTGGLCADGDLGHGLFWRKELNWQLLGWEWSHPSSEINTSGHGKFTTVENSGKDTDWDSSITDLNA